MAAPNTQNPKQPAGRATAWAQKSDATPTAIKDIPCSETVAKKQATGRASTGRPNADQGVARAEGSSANTTTPKKPSDSSEDARWAHRSTQEKSRLVALRRTLEPLFVGGNGTMKEDPRPKWRRRF